LKQGEGKKSSKIDPRANNRAVWAAGEASKWFHSSAQHAEKSVMANLQETVLKKIKTTMEDEILLDEKDWVTDPRQIRTRETKYFRLVEVH
jgi:hypothetical protein